MVQVSLLLRSWFTFSTLVSAIVIWVISSIFLIFWAIFVIFSDDIIHTQLEGIWFIIGYLIFVLLPLVYITIQFIYRVPIVRRPFITSDRRLRLIESISHLFIISLVIGFGTVLMFLFTGLSGMTGIIFFIIISEISDVVAFFGLVLTISFMFLAPPFLPIYFVFGCYQYITKTRFRSEIDGNALELIQEVGYDSLIELSSARMEELLQIDWMNEHLAKKIKNDPYSVKSVEIYMSKNLIEKQDSEVGFISQAEFDTFVDNAIKTYHNEDFQQTRQYLDDIEKLEKIDDNLQNSKNLFNQSFEERKEKQHDDAVRHLTDARELLEECSSLINSLNQTGHNFNLKLDTKFGKVDHELRKTKKAQQFRKMKQIAEGVYATIDRAEESFEEDNFNEAQREFERARTRFADAIGIAERYEIGDLEEYRSTLSFVRERIDDCKLNRQRSNVNTAESLLEDKEIDQAISQFESILSELPEVDVDRTDELAEIRRTTREGYLNARAERGLQKLEKAEQLFEYEEYEKAQEIYEDSVGYFKEIIEYAVKYEFPKLEKEINRYLDAATRNANESRRAQYDLEDISLELQTIEDVGEQDGTIGSSSDSYVRSQSQPPVRSDELTENLKDELPEHEIIETVGSGGNADVHKIRLTETNEVQALKVPRWHGTLSKDVFEEFTKEAETWSKLDDHENIITVHEWGASPYPWMILEFMEGGDLADHLHTMDQSEKANCLIQVCEAINHAHKRGVIHVDLKPENILFTSTSNGEVKIGDWGLAKVLLEHTNSIEGFTPSYAAPEQIDTSKFGRVDSSTDVYQLGIVTYEMFTGQVPFDSDSNVSTINEIIATEPTPPSEINPNVPDVIDRITKNTLAKQKDERYESILFLRDELNKIQ